MKNLHLFERGGRLLGYVKPSGEKERLMVGDPQSSRYRVEVKNSKPDGLAKHPINLNQVGIDTTSLFFRVGFRKAFPGIFEYEYYLLKELKKILLEEFK